jgi:hypothetical protein
MKTLTVRLPEELVAQIEAESRERRMSKSDVVRERLSGARPPRQRVRFDILEEVIGCDDGLPPDLGSRTKYYLKAWGYGQKRSRRH